MFEELKGIINNSYSNISNYKVASIVKMKDGSIFKGVNIENPSFKDGLCAEQVAIGSAISNGYTKGDFESIYVLGSNTYAIPPCFLCRQVLVEFFKEDDPVILYDINGNETKYQIKDLCPHVFGEENLKND